MDRAERRRREERVVAGRVRLLRQLGYAELLEMRALPGRLKKHNPLDCGRPRCQVCHRDKVFDDPRFDDAKSSLSLREGLEDLERRVSDSQ